MATKTVICPDCGGEDVAVVTDPRSSRPVIRKDFALVQCRTCGRFFSLDKAEIEGWCGASKEGDVVADYTPCRFCGYDQRSLTIGSRCPECGGEIRPVPPAEYVPFQPRPGLWGYLTMVLAAAIAILGILGAIYPTYRKPETFIGLCAPAAIGYGIKGLTTGRIAISPKYGSDVLTGFAGVLFSVAYVVLGLALGGLALYLFLGR